MLFKLRRTDRKLMCVTTTLPLSCVYLSLGYFLSEPVKLSVFWFHCSAWRRRFALELNLCFLCFQCSCASDRFCFSTRFLVFCVCVCVLPWRCFFSPSFALFVLFSGAMLSSFQQDLSPSAHQLCCLSLFSNTMCVCLCVFTPDCVCVCAQLHCCVSGAVMSFSARQHFCLFCAALSRLPPCFFSSLWPTVCDSTCVCIISPDDVWIWGGWLFLVFDFFVFSVWHPHTPSVQLLWFCFLFPIVAGPPHVWSGL